MFCEKCGCENDVESQFCVNCGKLLEKLDSNETENREKTVKGNGVADEMPVVLPEKEVKTINLRKQPLFYLGICALLFSAAIAVVSTMIHPHSAIIDKYEKYINEGDIESYNMHISEFAGAGLDEYSFSSEASSAAYLNDADNVKIEILVSKATKDENEQKVPTIKVIKWDDTIVEYDASDRIIRNLGEK